MEINRLHILTDEQLVRMAQEGSETAEEILIEKYKGLVKNKAKTYYITGADSEDVVQEGMIGLFKAIRDYDKNRPSSFTSFVELCIKRQIITAIKAANRKKHIPLNSYISLNKPLYEEADRILMDIMEGAKVLDPMEIFIIEEEIKKMESRMDSMLSDLEFEVIQQYLQGKSYEEISLEINRDTKCIDNAIQRVKKKLARYIIK